ncbi:MAG: TonB-dependent receptor [Candidatus Competibacteraceae bacterium]|nr:TonB-dependent receptor [Candidatus Competibacteraceae bacterium]
MFRKIQPLYFTLILLSGFMSLTIKAQHAVRGEVILQDGSPVEFASIVLYNLQDTSRFIGTVTSADGKFEFLSVPFKSAFVRVSMIGYTTSQSPNFVLPHSEMVTVIMQPSMQDIQEFSIVDFKPKLEIEAGKTTLNLENSTIGAGVNALELIRRIPGVFVDSEGNISIKGKSGVNVYIDDKPTYMNGRELKNLLTSINASNIEKIEVLTQPGVAFDAEGNAGILNIRLKKKMNLGFNATLEGLFGQGFYPKAGTTFTFNYGKGKWHLFGTYAYNFNKGRMETSMARTIGNAAYERVYIGVSRDHSHMAKLGFDYDINSKITIGAFVNANLTHNDWKGGGTAVFSNPVAQITDSLNTTSDYTPWHSYNFQFNLNTRWKIDSAGQKLSAQIDGGTYLEYTYGNVWFNYFNTWGDTIRPSQHRWFSQTPAIYLISGKADYVHPKLLGFHFEAGIKTSFVTNDAPVEYRTRDSLLNEVIIAGQTNHFLYQENINAIYFSFKRNFKKWGFNFGLRGEHSNITGTQLLSGQKNKQHYFNIFPTAGININPHSKHSISLLYTRRIDRPSYDELNPFIYVLDNFSTYQGNPNLLPAFSDNLEFNYTLFEALTLTSSYSYISNSASEVFIEDPNQPNKLIFTSGNIKSVQNFSSGLTFAMPVGKWLFMMVGGMGVYNYFNDTILNISSNGWFGMFNGYFEFYLPLNFSIELSGYALTGMPAGQQMTRPMGEVNLGASKTFFNDQLTLKCSLSDVFFTTPFRADGNAPSGETFYSTFMWDSRVFRFSLSYKIGKGNKQYENKTDAIFERVGGGRK